MLFRSEYAIAHVNFCKRRTVNLRRGGIGIRQPVEKINTIIITVDDDLEYMDGFIEYHLQKRKKYPNAALGFAGICSLDGSYHYATTVKQDVRVKILEHYKTVSYLRSMFEDDLFTDFVGKHWADDIVLSAYMGKQKIHKIVLNYEGDRKSTRLNSSH